MNSKNNLYKASTWTLILLLLLSADTLLAQEIDKDSRYLKSNGESELRSSTAVTDNYDVKYNRLELEVDPDIHYIKGMVCTYFIPLSGGFDSMQFDFRNNMTIDSIVYNGQLLNHSFPTSTSMEIQFTSDLFEGVLDSVKVYYQGAPYIDGFGSFETDQSGCSGDNPIMWTLSEPYGSKNWWPCKETLDDKIDSLDMIVSTPSEYRVASNGLLVAESNSGSYTTYHWKHRYGIPAYLVAFAVADYAVYSDFVDIPGSSDSIEVLNYVFPCDSVYASSQTPLLEPIFQFFIEKFGAYPYENEKYGHAQCGFGGGMEHSTMSFMGGFSVSLMAHELAHQWFGDKITCGTWNHIWLNEGFATYLDGLTCEQGIGYTIWQNWKQGMINNVTSNNYGSTYVYNTNSVYNIFHSRLVYKKGALLLHMLRWELGDEIFFDAIYNYITDPELTYNYAITDNLQTHLEMESGRDLSEFFDDWLYGQGWPNYNIDWAYSTSCNYLYVKIDQTHSANQGTFFEMKVPIKFSNSSSDTTLVFEQYDPSTLEFYVSLDFEPTQFTFDPERWLCAKSTNNIVSPPGKLIVWTGNENSDWFNENNWDCGVPTKVDWVIIPGDSPICNIISGNAICNKLHIEHDGSLDISNEATLTVYN